VEIWLHTEYRGAFGRLRQPGETITVRDGVGEGLIAKGAGCPVVDGAHQCQIAAEESIAPDDYLDEQMDAPANEVMLPVKWSRQQRLKLQAAARRSPAVRALIRGKRFEDIPRSAW